MSLGFRVPTETHEHDRGAVFPRRLNAARQYACTESKEARAVGVTAMLEPVPPPGEGWELVSTAIVGTGGDASAFFWWKR